tara:strand:+ start:6861 stop:7298 length:438 start_codon:yes stop_codon:yes gene_type:complete
MKMKNISTLVVLFSLLLAFSCNETVKSQAPDAVKKTFQSKYPGEDDPDWHKDANGNYESNFKIDGIKYRADFKPDGSWIETESSIDKDDLPKAIREKIKNDFDNGEITEVEKVQHHSKGLFYDVEFKQKGKNKDVEFKADGTIIN